MSHQTVQQLLLEKEQALADLNSVEKSLADLFRRYEKMKEVLEGFRKVREQQDGLSVYGQGGCPCAGQKGCCRWDEVPLAWARAGWWPGAGHGIHA